MKNGTEGTGEDKEKMREIWDRENRGRKGREKVENSKRKG